MPHRNLCTNRDAARASGTPITGIVGQAGQMVGVPGENVLYVISHKMGDIRTIQNGTLRSDVPRSVAAGVSRP